MPRGTAAAALLAAGRMCGGTMNPCTTNPFSVGCGPTPLVTPADTPADDGSSFTVTAGPCSLTTEKTCIRSPNYPGAYSANEHCDITVNRAGPLKVKTFNVEKGFDEFTVNGQIFTGEYDYDHDNEGGPNGVEVTAGTVMEWNTDGQYQRTGWEICLAAAPAFEIVSGSCMLVADKWPPCVHSPNYDRQQASVVVDHCPDNDRCYPNNDRCEITVLVSGILNSVEFQTELGYDFLVVQGEFFSGSRGPQGFAVAPGASITWRTDGSVGRPGWEVCLDTPVPTADPTTLWPPTQSPTLHPAQALYTTCLSKLEWMKTELRDMQTQMDAVIGDARKAKTSSLNPQQQVMHSAIPVVAAMGLSLIVGFLAGRSTPKALPPPHAQSTDEYVRMVDADVKTDEPVGLIII